MTVDYEMENGKILTVHYATLTMAQVNAAILHQVKHGKDLRALELLLILREHLDDSEG